MAEQAKNIKEVKASIGDLKMSPRKVRLVTDLVKHKSVSEALQQLRFVTKKATRPISKLILSAVANAQHNFHLDPEKLLIKNIIVNQGRVTKRFAPRAQGRAFPIRRRSSIVEVTLVESSGPVKKKRVYKPLSRKTERIEEEPVSKDAARQPDSAEKSKEKKKYWFKERGRHFTKRFVNLKKRLFNRKTNA